MDYQTAVWQAFIVTVASTLTFTAVMVLGATVLDSFPMTIIGFVGGLLSGAGMFITLVISINVDTQHRTM